LFYIELALCRVLGVGIIGQGADFPHGDAEHGQLGFAAGAYIRY
jgi:hypothetical protein